MTEIKLTQEVIDYFENENIVTGNDGKMYVLTLSYTYMLYNDKWYILKYSELPHFIINTYKDILSWKLEKLNNPLTK